MLKSTTKEELLHFVLRPAAPTPDVEQLVSAFLDDALGAVGYERPAPTHRVGALRWQYCFDRTGRLVAHALAKTPYEAVQGHTTVIVVISGRGPFVTAMSGKMERSNDGLVGYSEERPVSERAATLARKVAARFGLKYLDSTEMRDWEIDPRIADEAGIDIETGEYNGFTLLFYGY